MTCIYIQTCLHDGDDYNVYLYSNLTTRWRWLWRVFIFKLVLTLSIHIHSVQLIYTTSYHPFNKAVYHPFNKAVYHPFNKAVCHPFNKAVYHPFNKAVFKIVHTHPIYRAIEHNLFSLASCGCFVYFIFIYYIQLFYIVYAHTLHKDALDSSFWKWR